MWEAVIDARSGNRPAGQGRTPPTESGNQREIQAHAVLNEVGAPIDTSPVAAGRVASTEGNGSALDAPTKSTALPIQKIER